MPTRGFTNDDISALIILDENQPCASYAIVEHHTRPLKIHEQIGNFVNVSRTKNGLEFGMELLPDVRLTDKGFVKVLS